MASALRTVERRWATTSVVLVDVSLYGAWILSIFVCSSFLDVDFAEGFKIGVNYEHDTSLKSVPVSLVCGTDNSEYLRPDLMRMINVACHVIIAIL